MSPLNLAALHPEIEVRKYKKDSKQCLFYKRYSLFLLDISESSSASLSRQSWLTQF